MCWNATVSLNTYIVATFGTVFALMNGASPKIIAWFHLFSMMQLAEYFIWKNLENPYWNTVFSTFGLVILILEPLASMYLMNPGNLQTAFFYAYIGFLLLILLLYAPWVPRTKIGSNGHLEWLWQNKKMPLVFNLIWVAFFISPLFFTKYRLIGIISIITVMITIITYNKYGTWGSMWCWIANASWLFIIGAIALQKCYDKTICSKK